MDMIEFLRENLFISFVIYSLDNIFSTTILKIEDHPKHAWCRLEIIEASNLLNNNNATLS